MRYDSKVKASDEQLKVIKELFIKAGKKEKAERDYSMLSSLEAQGMINYLNNYIRKRIRSFNACRKRRQMKAKR